MRIAFVRRNWSPTGGAEHYLNRLATGLRARGHECVLLCEDWEQGQDPAFADVERFPVESLSFRRPRAFADAVNVRLASRGESLFDRVFSLERGIRADLYRAGDGVHREWLRLRRRHAPLMGLLRNGANPKNAVILRLERATFHPRNTRHIIANSDLVRRNIQAHFDYPPDRIHVVPNGVDAVLFGGGNRAAGRAALGWDEEEIVCLLVGAGAERKGHEAAREAARRAGADIRLVIVDEPPPCSMPDLYAAADIFLLPTLYDPFANVTLEAMAAGLPVITTQSNGGCEALRHGRDGFVVSDASDVREMASCLRALKDADLRRTMGAEAQSQAARYSLQRNIEATLRVIELPRNARPASAT
jgi:UDP-glucose:(heptosyl)LPS alpha-1,3-glucosyltransferase